MGDAGAVPLRDEAVSVPLETRLLSRMCYPTKFRRSRSNCLGVRMGCQKFWGRLRKLTLLK